MLSGLTPLPTTAPPQGERATGDQRGRRAARPGAGSCLSGSPTIWRSTAWWTSRSGVLRGRPAPRTRCFSTTSMGRMTCSGRRSCSCATGASAGALAAVARGPERQTLAAQVRAVWPALVAEESRVLDQAIGLMMYDPARYAELGRGASQQYLPALLSMCPRELVRPAQARGLRDDPRGPARFPHRLAGQRGHARESRPGSRPWPARWSGKRPPANSRPRSGDAP